MSKMLKALIVGLEPSWMSVARLPRALKNAGFEVGVACSSKSFLAATRFSDRRFLWNSGLRGGLIKRRLERIVEEWQPDLLIPGDDVAVAFLARVFEMTGGSGSGLAVLLKRSLGNPAAFLESISKRCVLDRAAELGVRTPASRRVRGADEVASFASQSGYPVVLKRSFGWGGTGVVICRNSSETAAAWTKLTGWKRRYKLWSRRLRGRVLGARWMPVDESVIVNQFVPGQPAMCQVVVVDGRVLAGVAAMKEKCHPGDKGPSSVVRFVPGEEMLHAAGVLAGRWKLSGFVAFDFIMDSQGMAWLIECNARPISIAHLSARAGEDLSLVLHNHLAGLPKPPRGAVRQELVVAHFPNEWLRDPASPYLTGAFHDVPWDDPDLLRKIWPRPTPPAKAK